jgi:hypothetical protein
MNRALKHIMQQMQMCKESLPQSLKMKGTDNKSERAHKEHHEQKK